MSIAHGSSDPEARVLRLFGGKWIAAALSAAAELGLADALRAGPRTAEDLARELDCDLDSLLRLLRVLEGQEIVSTRDARVSLTESGRVLCSDRLGDLARFVGAPLGWDPWSSLPEAIRSGRSAFELRNGESLFAALDREDHLGEATLYHDAIDCFSRAESSALAAQYDFGSASRVLDVGGGRGTLLIDVLKRWSHLEGVLLERPGVAADAAVRLSEAGLESRCVVHEGDFEDAWPSGADVVVLKHVVHMLDDETSTRLLEKARESVGRTGRVLVIEGILLPAGFANLTSLLDLEMLVLCGPGHERSKPEMRRLLSGAGLRVERSFPLAESAWLFDGRPR